MKRAVSSLCVLAVALIAVLGGMTYASADTVEEECDLVFRQALEEVIQAEGVTSPTIEVRKHPLYDIDLQLMGFAYCMAYDGQEGYAVVVNTDGVFRVSEFYMSAQVPFTDRAGQWIYVQPFSYLVWENEQYIEPETEKIVDSESVYALGDKAFRAGSTVTMGSNTIYYTNRTVDTFSLAKRCPAYLATGLKSACAPTAGANIVGYWTRLFPELIPGFTPGSTLLDYYIYKESAPEVQPVIQELYTLMGTDDKGTTISEFKSGMQSYVTARSREVHFFSTFLFDSFNYNDAKRILKSGIPLVLFVDGCEVISYNSIKDDHEYYQYMNVQGCHTMTGFGYQDVTYEFANGTTRTDSFIQVTTGLVEMLKGYYNLYYSTQLDDCFGVHIY